MQLKRIVTRLERLLAELSDLPPQGEPQRRSSAADIEGVADRWVRKYLRNHRVAAPQTADVIRVLQARTAYAISFANLLPRPRLELSLERSTQFVEVLMIDLWHGCFRQKWLGQTPNEQELAFAA